MIELPIVETQYFSKFLTYFHLDVLEIVQKEQSQLAVSHHFLEVDEGSIDLSHVNHNRRCDHVHALHVCHLWIVGGV